MEAAFIGDPLRRNQTASQRCPGTDRWGADGRWPSPVGLTLGILAVFAFQIVVMAYHYVRLRWCATRRVQVGARPYKFLEGMRSHLANPGGIVMMVLYLISYWMLDLMPCSYYSFEGGVRCWMVFAQITCQDLLMFLMHFFEHKGPLGPEFYKTSHKPHHRFVNPRLFDAFDGSVPDTFCMILIPLALTAQLLHANVWEYMSFGALWSGWLCLIHSEVHHPWDRLFSLLGLGTAADHHVHHRTFVYNYGHTMMWWDRLVGTYKPPEQVRQFNKSLRVVYQGGSLYDPDDHAKAATEHTVAPTPTTQAVSSAATTAGGGSGANGGDGTKSD